MMRVRRVLTQGPSNEALWGEVYTRRIGDRWAAMILRDDDTPPGYEELKGVAFFADTPEEAEQGALVYLGMCSECN